LRGEEGGHRKNFRGRFHAIMSRDGIKTGGSGWEDKEKEKKVSVRVGGEEFGLEVEGARKKKFFPARGGEAQ